MSKKSKIKFVKFEDQKIEEKVKNCKKKFEYSSSPNDECSSKCKYVSYCRAEFWGIRDHNLFKHNKKILKEQQFGKYLNEENPLDVDVPVDDEFRGDPSYIIGG